jgi:hypothetical protein
MSIDRRRLLELAGFATAERTTGIIAATVGGLGGQVALSAPDNDELKRRRRRERLELLTERMWKRAKFQLEQALKACPRQIEMTLVPPDRDDTEGGSRGSGGRGAPT